MVRFIRRHKFLVFRVFLTLMGLIICLQGVATLVKGLPDYTNYWGGAVSAPAAIGFGVLTIVAALRWKDRPTDARKRGKTDRQAPPSSPWDDFQKW